MKLPADVQSLLADLIAIPSVADPAHSGGTIPGEAAAAAYVGDFLRALGADVECREVQPGRPNVVARFSSAAPGAPTLALVPHLDTVGVKNMTIPPFTAAIRDGRMYGRGACDTKGPMAAAMWAIREWSQTGWLGAQTNLIFAATMGEEELSVGANALCRAGFDADLAVALEPTGLKLVRGAKGVLRLWVRATGRAAHGSAPEAGENAIFKLLPFIRACHEELMPRFAGSVDTELGPASLNVGVVRGGTELNIVPDICQVGLDIRTHAGFDNATALAAVQRAAGDFQVEIFRAGPAFTVRANDRLLTPFASSAAELATVPWYSDANVFNSFGIPAVAFGPGSIAQAHTRDEYIELSALAQGVAAFGTLLRDASSQPIPRRPADRPDHASGFVPAGRVDRRGFSISGF